MRYLITFFAIILSAAQIAAQGLHPLGLIWKDPRKTCPQNQAFPQLRDPKSLPPVVDHSAHMPPVGDQGNQGSCTAWAVGYYYKTYQEWREHGWSTSDPWHQFSPAFIYNQINNGYDYGSWFGDAFQLLCEQGCGPMALTPYYDGDCTNWPSEASYDSALYYRCQNWHWIDVSSDAGIQAVKQVLNDGDNVVIGLLVYANYDNINNYDTTFCVADISGEIRGGHANCIVGYDDNKMTHDGPGAFRVVNSWGTGWGNRGYYWFSYQALKDYRTSYQAAFYSSDRIGYQPSIKVRTRLTHPARSTVNLSFGLGNPSSPDWTKSFYTNYGGGPRPFPANNMVFDLSEATPYLSTSLGNNIFICCRDEQYDGQSGTINEFSATEVPWGCQAFSYETPVAIEDNSTNSYANLSLHYRNFSLSLSPPLDTVSPNGQAHYSLSLNSLNGFNHSVGLQYQISPQPTTGSLVALFSSDSAIPSAIVQLNISASANASPGHYLITITAVDPIDTIIHTAQADLWVLGKGQALCIGGNQYSLSLIRNIWTSVDSLCSVPPYIGGNYQAMVIQSGAVPNDSARLRQFVWNGGKILLLEHTPQELCGGTDLRAISSWLGADYYNYYWGSGINIVCHYDHPFNVSNIVSGDVFGLAGYGTGRLFGIHPDAITLAHLGTVQSAIAAIYNMYGNGHCFWYAGCPGMGIKGDSLLLGFLQYPQGAISNPADKSLFKDETITCSISPNPVKSELRLSLFLP